MMNIEKRNCVFSENFEKSKSLNLKQGCEWLVKGKFLIDGSR